MKIELTEPIICTLTTEKIQEDVYCVSTPGAGLRVSKEGSKSFFMIYASPTVQNINGLPLSRRLTLGAHISGRPGQGPYLTLAEFTALYEVLRGELRRGLDPADSEHISIRGRQKNSPQPREILITPEFRKLQLKSRQQFADAVRTGKIKRKEFCEHCGKECVTDGHHKDYSKPFLVQWLCRKCHRKAHKNVAVKTVFSNLEKRF
jgi:hypothetical protein